MELVKKKHFQFYLFFEEFLISNEKKTQASLLSRYNLKQSNKRYVNKKDRFFTDISINDCVKNCNDEIGIDCKSFHYCYKTTECVLSKDMVPSDNDEFQAVDNCDIYESKRSQTHYLKWPFFVKFVLF